MTESTDNKPKRKRCLHQDGELAEIMLAAHYRLVVDGNVDGEGVNEMGDIVAYRYTCGACGKQWSAKTISSFRFKWLKKIGEQL